MKNHIIFKLGVLAALTAVVGCSYLNDPETEDGRLAFANLVKDPPNTQKLERLPSIDQLVNISKSLAALDCIYEDRFHNDRDADVKFTEHWQDREGEKVLQLEWEGNDSLVIWFSPGGCVIKGHDEESVMNPVVAPFDLQEQEGKKLYPGLLKGFPHQLKGFLKEPDFSSENATFVIWRKVDDDSWHIGPITWPNRRPNRFKSHDGSDDLLSPLAVDAKAYANWLKKAKNRKVNFEDVEKIFKHEPLTAELLKRLDSHKKLADLKEEFKTIGYPIAE
ncbi:MAG: hypothetical protein K2Y39_04480 [Candidatus Obscuribacterales bacterium]|nr:hypothetical protein [Candidatus Obscuribacterales bacterium]